MSNFSIKIGKKIALARKANRLSQRALAKKLGISQQVLSKYEVGTSPLPLEVFVNLCTLFDAPYSWFIDNVRQYGDIVSEEDIELLNEIKKFVAVNPLLSFIKGQSGKQNNDKKRRCLAKC